MATNIRRRLVEAEEEMIETFSSGSSSAFQTFETSWSALVHQIVDMPLDPDILDFANEVASRVASLASGFIELHTKTSYIRSTLLSDLNNVFGQLSLDDLTGAHLTQPPRASPSGPSSPPYIAPAYKWLMKNIHNPYPSKETKELISHATGTSLQHIDAWFLNARRRIGWTSISKKYFGNSKIDTISAAIRALRDDLNPSVSDDERAPHPANIRMAFVEMENAAKELYSDKFTKSELAGTLDRMVKDMTDDDRMRRRDERKKEKALEKLRAERIREDKRSQDAQRRWKEAEEGYPSPSPESERRSETPSSVDSEDEEDLTPPLPIAGRKRTSTEDSRPAKRSRILSSSSSCSSVDTLCSRQNSLEPFPSSPSSTACSTPPPSTPSEDTSTSLPQDASPKRKRRLSDADAEPRPKHPMPVRPRLQIVSDPLPKSVPSVSPSTSSSSPVDESVVVNWSKFFDQHFMAVTDELDTAGPIKMDMFDYSQFADYASGGKTSDATDWGAQCEPFKSKGLLDPISQSSSPAIHVPSLTTFTDFDLPAPVSVLPDFELDFCATLGWPYVGTIPSKQTWTGSALEDTELNKLDGLSSLASLPPYQPGISSMSESPRSDEAAFDPLGSIDWSSIIPQTIPPTRPAVSTLLTPVAIAPTTTSPTAYLGSTAAESRAEKLRKYQEHLAQARQLEAELAYV